MRPPSMAARGSSRRPRSDHGPHEKLIAASDMQHARGHSGRGPKRPAARFVRHSARPARPGLVKPSPRKIRYATALSAIPIPTSQGKNIRTIEPATWNIEPAELAQRAISDRSFSANAGGPHELEGWRLEVMGPFRGQ